MDETCRLRRGEGYGACADEGASIAFGYQKMRGLSMDEVKRTNGKIDFEDALLSERSV